MSSDTFLVPLHQMRPSANIPAGLNPLVVMAVAHSLRNAGDGGYGPCRTAPILVRPNSDDSFVITDGRHRWMAHWIAGLGSAECQLDPAYLSERRSVPPR
jgi:hypothetical protein